MKLPNPVSKKLFRLTSLHSLIKFGFMTILIFLVAFILFYNFYSVYIYQGQIAESERRTIAVYAESVDAFLSTADSFLIDMVANVPEFGLLGTKDTPLNVHIWSWTLLQRMKHHLTINKNLSGLFLYSGINELYQTMYRSDADMEERYAAMDAVKQLLEERDGPDETWRPVLVEGEYFLFRSAGLDSVRIAALVSFDDITVGASEGQSQEGFFVLYSDRQGSPLTGGNFVASGGITLPGEGVARSDSPGYRVISQRLRRADVVMHALVPERSFLHGLSMFHLFFFYVSILLVLLVPMGYIRVKRLILVPLDNIDATMRRIGAGQYNEKLSGNYRLTEFVKIENTFNNMMDQIRNLKIEAYERELEKQHAHLQYLHLQIKPHFFLNCLKSIYGLAERGRTGDIQEMALELSGYFRYMFRDNMQTIPLRDELEHIKNYMRLQGLGSESKPVCNISVEQRLLRYPIPPLSIQTFVENSVIHGTADGRRLQIDICVDLLEVDGEARLDITVSDNGPGFPDGTLEELNAPVSEAFRDRHVGIQNVRLRTKLLYGSEAELFFYNSGSGSVSEIILPAGEIGEVPGGEAPKPGQSRIFR